MKHFLIFGTHPSLSLAEASSVFGGPDPLLAGPMALFDTQSWDGAVLMERLAGTTKLGDIILAAPVTADLATRLADLIDALPRADRVLYGLTIYGGTAAERKRLKHLPIELKKMLKERGRSSRWVTGDKNELSPAAVAKLKLTSEGYDFCLALIDGTAHVGLTTHVQDADAWSHRDFGRPFRDAKTGMLPPKLARMMVNLAIGTRNAERGTPNSDAPGSALRAPHILDPFCGAGTVLMEAVMLHPNATVLGSDIDAKQVAGTKRNFEWLMSEGIVAKNTEPKLFASPAQSLDKHQGAESVDAIVTEGYLGRPLQGNEPQQELDRRIAEVEAVWRESLPALSHILAKGGRFVACAPSYRTTHGKATLDLATLTEPHGYRLLDQFEYARPDQHVVRRIFVLEKG